MNSIKHNNPLNPKIDLKWLAQISGIPLEDHLVLVPPYRDQLHVLNPTAQFIWNRLADNVPVRALAENIQEKYGIELKHAQRELGSILDHWQSEGLLAPCDETDFDNPLTFAAPPPPEVVADFRFTEQCTYSLAGVVFRIRYQTSRLHFKVHQLLFGLEAQDPAVSLQTFDMVESGVRYKLRMGRQEILMTRSLDELVTTLLHELLNLGCRRDGLLTVLHAGAVGKNGRCLVLPAAGGSGKTTLIAALVASGLSYFSDDVVPIAIESLQAIPIPTPLCIKEGSWEALAHWCKELNNLASYTRGQQQVKFLPPTDLRENSICQSGMPVNALIFSDYQDGHETSLTKISALQTLQHLIESDSLFEKPLRPLSITRLVEWIENTPAYELYYSDLEDVVPLIHRLFGDLSNTNK